MSEALALGVEGVDFAKGAPIIQHHETRLKLNCPQCNARLGKANVFCPSCGAKVEQAVEQQARRQGRAMSPENVARLTGRYMARSSYKASNSPYRSFVGYSSNLRLCRGVHFSGKEEPSAFRGLYPPGPPRRSYRLTAADMAVSESAWADPCLAL